MVLSTIQEPLNKHMGVSGDGETKYGMQSNVAKVCGIGRLQFDGPRRLR
jgi:hypothetical protein